MVALTGTASSSEAKAATTAGASCSTPRSAIAKTQYGKVRGYEDAGVLTFKGVPYGQSTAGENRYIFRITNPDDSKDLTLATVTADGNFPSAQIKTLIDEARQNAIAILQIQQSSLMQSIRMVNAMGTQSTFLKAVNGVAKIASAETETGQGRNILEGTASGENAQAWLSAAFLKRAAEACKGELVMRITNNTKPILIEAGSFTAVIMPMMVEGSKDPFPEDEAIAISLPEMAMA